MEGSFRGAIQPHHRKREKMELLRNRVSGVARSRRLLEGEGDLAVGAEVIVENACEDVTCDPGGGFGEEAGGGDLDQVGVVGGRGTGGRAGAGEAGREWGRVDGRRDRFFMEGVSGG